MPAGLQRYYGKGDLHFVTFGCYHRRTHLKTVRAKNLFVRVLSEVRHRYGFQLVGYVVMPDHVHLLISEPKRNTPSTVVQVLKQRVSRALRTRESDNATTERPQPFWETRFYDFNVWSDAKRREKLEYMHANPVTKGLVEDPRDWPWSSWPFYHSGPSGLVVIDPIR
jgi:putative transposase